MIDKRRKPFRCNKCGKRFDEPLPTMVSYLPPDSDHIPETMEVCPYCFSDDLNVDIIMNPFILGMMIGINVYQMANDAIDEAVAKGELVLEDE